MLENLQSIEIVLTFSFHSSLFLPSLLVRVGVYLWKLYLNNFPSVPTEKTEAFPR